MAKLKNLSLTLALLVAVVLVAGCLQIEIREDVGASGTSDLTMKLIALNVSAVGWDKKNPCDDFNASESSPLLSGAKCRFDGKTETITAKFNRIQAGGLTITGTKYRFDLITALEGFNDKEENSAAKPVLQEKKNATLIKQYKDAGIRYDYIVKLPGKVTGHSGCEIMPDGSAKFDMLELEAKDKPYVESDTGLMGGLLGGSSAGDKPAKTADDRPKLCCMPALTMLLALGGAAVTKIF